MHICFATYQSVMLLKGGPQTQILQLKHCLENLGHRITLFETWKEFNKSTFDAIHLFGANIGTYHLAREIYKLGIPLIVSPIFYTRQSISIVKAVLSIDKILHKITHGTWTDYGLVAEICSWAKMIIPNTTLEAELCKKGFGIPEEKITIIPNGVEERFYNSNPKIFVEKYGVENFILNVGHIGPARKNVLKLIRALAEIDTPAVIIGRKENNNYSKQCFDEAKKNPRLIILDSLPHESDLLSSAYAACDVFALPSQYETPGIAALEAALAGAKILITNKGGTEDYFGSFAEYVNPNSIESIRKGILFALSKPKDNTLREHIRKNFLWNSLAEKMLNAYEKI